LPVYSLTDLNLHIRQTLEDAYPEALWIRAEIASYNLNSFSGHCYLELTDGQGQTAKAKAMIWKKTFEVLEAKFRIQTGSGLGKGMQVQLLAKVEFNIQYGLSLVVWDIDASYTLGDLAIRKMEILNRIRKEGWFEKNQNLTIPFPTQRIAVVSSPTAAGLEDFRNHLEKNEYGFQFLIQLFPAQMQGKEAALSVANAFEEIKKQKEQFDLVALIRGGGSSLDLQAFDEYETAAAIGNCPIPVLTGIGHERDESVCDLVANQSFKTPTAVAHFLIDGLLEADALVAGLCQTISQNLNWAIRKQEQEFEILQAGITRVTGNRIQKERTRLNFLVHESIRNFGKTLYRFQSGLDLLESQIRLANPTTILQKGYARILQDGKIRKSKKEIAVERPIVVQLQDGSLRALPTNEQ
jgi:exodeoxyribonuclease VII large subunit